MKKAIQWIVVLAVLAGAGYWYYSSKVKKTASGKPAYDRATVERQDLSVVVESTGEVQPRNRLDVKPPIDGRLEELMVDEGDSVDKGQIIGWISSTERATLLDAALATSKEELAYWQELYKPTPLISPLKGAIIARNFEPGQSISDNDPVVVIADDLIVIASLDETDIGLVKLGQKVTVRLEAYPDLEFTGVVEKIAYDAVQDSDITMYEVDVRAEQLPDVARSGMTANLKFVITDKKGVLVIPAAAVQQGPGRSPSGGLAETDTHVLIAGDLPGQPDQKPIETGISDGSYVEILAGLEEGEEVLIQNINISNGSSSGGRNPFSTGIGRPPR